MASPLVGRKPLYAFHPHCYQGGKRTGLIWDRIVEGGEARLWDSFGLRGMRGEE